MVGEAAGKGSVFLLPLQLQLLFSLRPFLPGEGQKKVIESKLLPLFLAPMLLMVIPAVSAEVIVVVVEATSCRCLLR